MSKTLIAYFSRADENYFGGSMRYIEVGNTEVAVGKIRELIDADVFKIEMVKPYSKAYMTCIEEAKADLRAKARPDLVSMPESIDEYDTIILAYPNYWEPCQWLSSHFWKSSIFQERPSCRCAPMKAAAWAEANVISQRPVLVPELRMVYPSAAAVSPVQNRKSKNG